MLRKHTVAIHACVYVYHYSLMFILDKMGECLNRVEYYDKKVFGIINQYWSATVKFLRAKEFLAELVGTFMLVVSFKYYIK